MANTYPVGQLVRLTGTFTDENNNPIDPATITLTVEVNDGSTDLVVPTTGLVNPSTGTWTYDYDAASTGLVEYRFVSATPQAVGQSYFVVERSRIS